MLWPISNSLGTYLFGNKTSFPDSSPRKIPTEDSLNISKVLYSPIRIIKLKLLYSLQRNAIKVKSCRKSMLLHEQLLTNSETIRSVYPYALDRMISETGKTFENRAE